jgi:hypothetical protein
VEGEGGEYKDCNRKEGEKGTSQEQEQEDPVSSNEQYRNHDFAWEELAFHIGLFFIQNSSELENFSSGIYQDWDEKFDATVRRNSPPMGNTSDSRRKGVAHDSIPPIGKGNASIMG